MHKNALFFWKIAKITPICGLPDPLASCGWGFALKPPASCGWGLCLQALNGLRRMPGPVNPLSLRNPGYATVIYCMVITETVSQRWPREHRCFTLLLKSITPKYACNVIGTFVFICNKLCRTKCSLCLSNSTFQNFANFVKLMLVIT